MLSISKLLAGEMPRNLVDRSRLSQAICQTVSTAIHIMRPTTSYWTGQRPLWRESMNVELKMDVRKCEREAWTDGRRLLQHWGGCKGKGRVRGLQSYKYGFSRRFPCLYTECMVLLQIPTTASSKDLPKVGNKITSKTDKLMGRV